MKVRKQRLNWRNCREETGRRKGGWENQREKGKEKREQENALECCSKGGTVGV